MVFIKPKSNQPCSEISSYFQRQITKGYALLEEFRAHSEKVTNGSSIDGRSEADEPDCRSSDVSKSLRDQLQTFADKLEETRGRMDDTTRCYEALDKAYEWGVEAMRLVTRLKIDSFSVTSFPLASLLLEQAEGFIKGQPDLEGLLQTATRLGNSKLVEQFKVAQNSCKETLELLTSRKLCLEAHFKLKRQGTEEESISVPQEKVSNALTNQKEGSPELAKGEILSKNENSEDTNPAIDIIENEATYDIPPVSSSDLLLPEDQTYEEIQDTIDSGISTDDISPTKSFPRNSIVYSSLTSSSSGVTSSSGSVEGRMNKKCPRSWQPDQSSQRGALSALQSPYIKLGNYQSYSPYYQRSFSSGSYRSKTDSFVEKERSCCSGYERDGPPASKPPRPDEPPERVVSPIPVQNSHLNSIVADVSDVANLDEPSAKLQRTLVMTVREMVQTERDYVNALEYIVEHYIPELDREDIPQSLRGKRNVIFGNVEKIYAFHSRYFLRDLERCEKTPLSVAQCLLKHEQHFYLYALYNKNKPKSDYLMQEYGHAFFKKKQLELGDKMDLGSYLLKPVQRMGKYALLLAQLIKLSSEALHKDSKLECVKMHEVHDLISAERMVRFQLRHGNDLLAMDSIRECDVNLKEQGRLLRQGEFTVYQGKTKKIRHVFLFEDLILFSKAKRDPERKNLDNYVYKNSLKTSDIGFTARPEESPNRFEIWFRKRSPQNTYQLQATSTETRDSWVDEIARLLWKQAIRNRELRMAEMAEMGIGNKPCLAIRPSEDQISDRSIDARQLTKIARQRPSLGNLGDMTRIQSKRPHSIISVTSSSGSSGGVTSPTLGANHSNCSGG
ncbi:hypothetical protein QYM36_006748 [Artemia franciscana]|uniref:Puratrophin-1 n=1 Tax=Artemia franciscana TaxID=6661 RepID=A0AA88HVV3_ARTSF|nr:hypothetical protein QYM36_006748 [Artemia franciscana]